MSHRVFENFQYSRDVSWLRNSLSRLFDRASRRELAAARASRTLAEKADYSWETGGMNGQIGNGRNAFFAVCRGVDDRDPVWIGFDRLSGLNGRYRLSC